MVYVDKYVYVIDTFRIMLRLICERMKGEQMAKFLNSNLTFSPLAANKLSSRLTVNNKKQDQEKENNADRRQRSKIIEKHIA